MTRLAADCARCAALCCVAPAFARSSDFAIDKPAGQPCRNLGDDFRCTIHQHLERRGFHGCVVFDCFGAGQRITNETFGGQDWRSTPDIAGDMFAVLPVMRQLHELMWYLTEALELNETRRLHPGLRAALDETDALAGRSPEQLRKMDVDAYRGKVVPLLRRASEMARAGRRGPDHSGARLIGRRMRGADLRGASFRGALLIGADLRDADLRRADFTGADMRGTDLRGANLSGALFLTSSQLRAAVTGDDRL
ncbi:pentapeptide repeat-containing protein [Actinoplanes sp. NPDC049802]|uniref:pentapeptide repeat-containing protein n=1 Tax=Actinoplanes sp. NPDC049802 TaxID=3154742 RepID=UPI0033D71FD5